MLISGRVQGVGVRYACQARARQLGVSGWVRNLADGRVEALVEGDDAAVEAMLEWCREGPRGSRVAEVQLETREASGLDGFGIERTA